MTSSGAERRFKFGVHMVVPYADAETSYDTRYNIWIRQLYRAGAEFEIARGWRIEPY